MNIDTVVFSGKEPNSFNWRRKKTDKEKTGFTLSRHAFMNGDFHLRSLVCLHSYLHYPFISSANEIITSRYNNQRAESPQTQKWIIKQSKGWKSLRANVLKFQTLFSYCSQIKFWLPGPVFSKCLRYCFFRSSLIWVCPVCLGLFGRELVFAILENLQYQQLSWW